MSTRRQRAGLAESVALACLAGAVLLWFFEQSALAAEPASACPSREAVGTAVRALLRPSRMNTAGIDAQFDVQDLGERYSVTVKGRRREYTDEPRDCSKRAHVAAVFVALTLAPPDIPLPEQPDPAPASSSAATSAPRKPAPESSATAASASAAAPKAAAAPAPASASTAAPKAADAAAPPPEPSPSSSPSPSPWSLQIELGAVALFAPRVESSQVDFGGELRFSALRDVWGVTLGASLATPSTLELQTVPVRESRVPVDLGARRSLRFAQFRGSLELGLVAALTRLRQEELPGAQTKTQVEFGARAAGVASLDTQFSPYLSVFTYVYPVPHELAAEPRGSIGHTSALWVGVSLGGSAKFP